MSITPFPGRAGIPSPRTGTTYTVSYGGPWSFMPGTHVIEGTKSRDSGNTDNIRSLRPGLLMGKITSGGFYAPSIIGVTTAAASATDTSVTISPAQATELVRRVGATGTLRFVGPPSAAGTVATFTETYSAVNTTTGVVTVSALNADLIEGAFVTADDGTHLPITLISDGFGILIPDDDSDASFPHLPVGGYLDVDKIIDWPSDTSLQTWIKDSLSTTAGGKWVFSDTF